MNGRQLALSVFIGLGSVLGACGDSADTSTSAKPVADSAKPSTSSSATSKTTTSASAAAATPAPSAVASAPASAAASASAAPSASAVASAKTAPPADGGFGKKDQDDLMNKMLAGGGSSGKPTPAAGSAKPAAGEATPSSDKVADAFAGAPDAAIKLGKSLKVAGYSLDLPDGWEGADADNMIKAHSKGKGAWIFVTPAPNEEAVTNFLKKNATADGIQWVAANPFKLGKANVDGKLAKGTGKVGTDDADMSYFLADGASLMTVVTKKSTGDERSQLIAAVRSFHK